MLLHVAPLLRPGQVNNQVNKVTVESKHRSGIHCHYSHVGGRHRGFRGRGSFLGSSHDPTFVSPGSPPNHSLRKNMCAPTSPHKLHLVPHVHSITSMCLRCHRPTPLDIRQMNWGYEIRKKTCCTLETPFMITSPSYS